MLRKIPFFYYLDGEKIHGEFRSDHEKISPFYTIGLRGVKFPWEFWISKKENPSSGIGYLSSQFYDGLNLKVLG